MDRLELSVRERDAHEFRKLGLRMEEDLQLVQRGVHLRHGRRHEPGGGR